IVKEHIIEGSPVNEWLAGPEYTTFHGKQKKLLLSECGHIDPEDIDAYIASGGYKAAKKVLAEMSEEQVISEIKASGLRGRGGGGFPTGLKWDICRRSAGDPKYIVCNADEGGGGAIIESNPHSVIEGMIIGAYAIGSNQGFAYIRADYTLAIQRLRLAIKHARQHGYLGRNIFGTDLDFNIEIKLRAGAFVCGEETALMASIEDQIGEPRPKPPFPADKGLWGKPTNINNVQTWAAIPHIINNGALWFASIGTEKSKGTKIFSLGGKVNNTGVIEVPMGTPLRDIIYDIGGGVPNNKKFKAVQTGGPSGGCIPASQIDMPVDYENLVRFGSILGSGGLVVMDEDTCMVDVAKFFLSYCMDESCGKCTPCREGTKEIVRLLDDITKGKGTETHIKMLEELSLFTKEASLCGLGKTAPNPVLSTLRFFREEYDAHVIDKKCPAKVCRALITFMIDAAKCTGCTVCARNCPQGAITGEKKKPHAIDQDKCIKCGICYDVCKFKSVMKD
ncbi:MAG: 4Fe-4S binding protein, partial [Nitrospirae bacterium]|nr:4Fe-4S binding protein [Nitrospirota bacterium]